MKHPSSLNLGVFIGFDLANALQKFCAYIMKMYLKECLCSVHIDTPLSAMNETSLIL